MKCVEIIFHCVMTFMSFSDIISSSVCHFFPACEVKLNISLSTLEVWKNPHSTGTFKYICNQLPLDTTVGNLGLNEYLLIDAMFYLYQTLGCGHR